MLGRLSVVTPVYGNEATLEELYRRLAAVLAGEWSLRFVVDASPDASLAVARRLAAADDRVSVTALEANVGQHAALLRGLAADDADVYACLDADLQDPPEAVPLLVGRLGAGEDHAGAFLAMDRPATMLGGCRASRASRAGRSMARKAPASTGTPVSRACSLRCRAPVMSRLRPS